jgi:MscS family membrane protein
MIRVFTSIVAVLMLSVAVSPLQAADPEISADAYNNPLSPPNTSSPRATLRSFLENFEKAYRPVYEGDEFPFPSEAEIFRILRTLDTSELAPAQHRRLAMEAAFQLYEVLARIELPPYEAVPNAQQMSVRDKWDRRRWLVSGTEIEIVEMSKGPMQGEFLFSADTLSRVAGFYHRARNLQYRPGTMTGLYERVRYEAGPWFSSGMVRALPDWFSTAIFGQAVWKWIASVLSLSLWLLLVVAAHRLSSTGGEKPRYWLRFFLALSMLPLTYVFREFLVRQVIVIGHAYQLIDPAMVVAYYFFSATAILNLGAAVAQSIIESNRIKLTGIEPNLIAVAGRAIAWVVVILLILKGADVLGIPLPAVIASLGVGGIALGMAARPTLENLIAGVTLHLDKPVRVGEFCQFGDVVGAVEEIGLRSTRVRRWGGNLVSIPNSQFAEYRLDNYNDSRNLLIRTTLNLRYETTTDQLRYVLAKLGEMLVAHSGVMWPRVRFKAFGDYALEIDLVCYCDTGVWAEWYAIREDVYLRVKEIIEEAGTGFALPSQTTYFARDPGLDAERGEQAEARVEAWRESGMLPFPNRSADQIEQIENTIEFPAKGSVGYKHKSEG